MAGDKAARDCVAYPDASQFLHLPIELREHIYLFYFLQANELESRPKPHEPALTRVSKSIRRESLPVYYSTYILPILTFIRCSYHGQVWLRTEGWFHRIAPVKLALIRHFRLNFALIDRYTGQRVPIDFTLDFSRGRRSPRIQHSFPRSWFRNPHRIGDPADFEDLISVIRGHLSAALDAISRDGKSGCLSAEDIDCLVKVDPDSLPI